MFLVDSNVLLDILSDDATWRPWSEPCLRDALLEGEVAINPIIYAETSVGFRAPESLDAELDAFDVTRLGLPYEAAFLAGRAFRRYRRAGGVRSSPLPDFYIGAHAEVAGLTVLTRDVSRFRTYFPTVRLISPVEH